MSPSSASGRSTKRPIPAHDGFGAVARFNLGAKGLLSLGFMEDAAMKKIVLPLLLFALAFPALGDGEEHPLLPADISSPRATFDSFMKNCDIAYRLLKEKGRSSGDEQTRMQATEAVRNIERCMDLSKVGEFRRDDVTKEAAVSLKEVFDRIELPPERKIPDREDMMRKDGSLIESWTFPNTEITFHLIKDGPLAGSYQFTPDTVARAGEFYQRVAFMPYKEGATKGFATYYFTSPESKWLARLVNTLPAVAWERTHGQTVWQWAGLVIVLLLTAALMAALYFMGRRVSKDGPAGGMWKYLLGVAFPILSMLVPLEAARVIARQLAISGNILYVIKFNLGLLSLLCGMVVVMTVARRVGEVIATSPRMKAQSVDAQLVRMMSRLFGLVFSVVLLIEGGKHLGIPLSSLLAGAGVAGAALALSVQDMLKNVFGSIMLFMDKPFVVGEQIKAKQYCGFVEEIGLRSTKIRLLNGHLAVIPNEEMSKTDIENIGRRPFIRRDIKIPLAIDIAPAKAHRAAEIAKELLRDHEGFKPDRPPRVWLDDFERDHLRLKITYWYHPPEYWKFTEHADRVNRQILEAFEKEGIAIALPAFTARMEQPSENPLPPPPAEG